MLGFSPREFFEAAGGEKEPGESRVLILLYMKNNSAKTSNNTGIFCYMPRSTTQADKNTRLTWLYISGFLVFVIGIGYVFAGAMDN